MDCYVNWDKIICNLNFYAYLYKKARNFVTANHELAVPE